MKRFSFIAFLSISLFASAIFITSCQKEEFQTANANNPQITAGDRAPIVYGVTVYRTGVPSHLVGLDLSSGSVQSDVTVSVAGIGTALDDLKGVCFYQGQVWITTGPNVPGLYRNSLLKVDPTTGQATMISQSTIGTVSDIDYDPISATVYGLADNSNGLISIVGAGNNWATYTKVGNITNIPGGYSVKGLSMVRDNVGTYLTIAATDNFAGDAKMFTEPITAGAATFMSNVGPIGNLAGSNCGIGFQFGNTTMSIARNSASFYGANSFAWTNPLVNPVSGYWGGTGYNFEDFTTTLQ